MVYDFCIYRRMRYNGKMCRTLWNINILIREKRDDIISVFIAGWDSQGRCVELYEILIY